MSWKSGSRLFDRIWKELRLVIPKNKRVSTVKVLIEAFENFDCDTIYGDSEWPEVSQALKELHPDHYESE